MQKYRVSETDVEVSMIGLGTVKFGRNVGVKYPTKFALPTDHDLCVLLQKAKELGINLLDTAPAYGTSEERVGQLLKNKRHDWIIMTKAGEEFNNGESRFDFTPTFLSQSVEKSLQRLQTDYLDIVLIHSNGEDERIIQEYEALKTLSELKKSGKIRAFGMSTKTIAGGLLAIDYADAVMVTFNPLYTDERVVIREAYRKNKAVFIKKAFVSGHLNQLNTENPVDLTMQTIWQEAGVTSVIAGTINVLHLEENVRAALKYYN